MDNKDDVAVVIAPLHLQSHLRQLLHFACRISSYGLPVYYLGLAASNREARQHSTTLNPCDIEKIHFHDLQIPNEDPPPDIPMHIWHASMRTREPIASFLGDISSKARRIVVVHDLLMSYNVQDISSYPNGESYVFHCLPIFDMYCSHYAPAAGFPIPLEEALLKRLPSNDGCYNPEDVEHHAKYLNHCMGKNAGDIFNTSQVIDGTAIVDSMANLATMQNKKLWALGPILLTQDHDKVQTKHFCLDWLNKQPPKSVIYVSFGTSTSFSAEQIKELAIGLELSKQKFIWVLRNADVGDPVNNKCAVVQAFERIKKPSRKEFGLMVNYYGRRGDMHRARETFEKMRARGIEPTVHVYTNLIHAYAVARDMEEALSCVRRMKDEGIEMSLVTHSILVDGFAKLGNIEAAEQCFKEAKERYLTLNAIIYGSIIYANCQTCNMDRAEELVREMEEEGIDAPIDIYHIMMDGYTSIGNEDKCLILFDRLKECGFTPSVVSYGCLMNLFIKVGKVSKAFEVSEMMKLAGIKHNMKTYSMLINGFINLKDWANAFAIFEDVIRDGLKPDVVLYNNIIRAFCGMGNIERAVRIVEEMKKERHRPTSRTFMPIIHAFAKAGEIRKALDVFDMMRRSGCIPTVQTFNALILGLVEKLQMEKAVQVLDEMLLAGIRPNERTYTTIMDGYASLGDTGKAFEYFSRIKDEGLELDIYTYEALLKACCKAGRMQSALAVTKEMSAKNIPRNTYVYNILIDGWARRGDVWEAADLMQQMRQEGVQPDIHTYTSFVNACCKAGDMQKATNTILEMKRIGVKPNVKTYTTLIHGWARASLPEKALKCFEEMKRSGLKPDKAVYHCLMTSLLSRATVAEYYIIEGIHHVCEEMVESGLTVDMGTAVHWSRCLRKHRRILAAPDHNPKTSISMDPTLKKQPKPTPFTSKSTIHNISNQFSHLNANHKILKSGHTSYSLDTHLNPKSWTDSSCSALTKSKSQQGKTEAIIKKVPQRGKEFHKEVDVKRGSVNLSKSQEIEKFKGFDEIKKQSLSVLLKNNGRRKSFCGSKIELTDFFSCSGVKVVSVDMPPFMQVHAVNCARKTHDSLEKFTSKALALTLKKEFDEVYGPAWHCIVGTSFGSFVTHSIGGFMYFSMDHKIYVLLFKTTVQKAESSFKS